jgi:uncharacterized protein (DUF488 family)
VDGRDKPGHDSSMSTRPFVLTIGHSNHALAKFIALLHGAEVMAIADVRSAPVSRFAPHFNKDRLATSLAEQGIAYVFLGKELGGRPELPELFSDGVADYEKMAALPAFKTAIERLITGAESHRVAIMCAEVDPLDCHRCLLVGRALADSGVDVGHILSSGQVLTHAEIEDRLLDLAGLTNENLLAASRGERLAEAYRARARKATYAVRKAPVSARGGRARRD